MLAWLEVPVLYDGNACWSCPFCTMVMLAWLEVPVLYDGSVCSVLTVRTVVHIIFNYLDRLSRPHRGQVAGLLYTVG